MTSYVSTVEAPRVVCTQEGTAWTVYDGDVVCGWVHKSGTTYLAIGRDSGTYLAEDDPQYYRRPRLDLIGARFATARDAVAALVEPAPAWCHQRRCCSYPEHEPAWSSTVGICPVCQ